MGAGKRAESRNPWMVRITRSICVSITPSRSMTRGSLTSSASSWRWPETEVNGVPTSCATIAATSPTAASRSRRPISRRASKSFPFKSRNSAVACATFSWSSPLKLRIRRSMRLKLSANCPSSSFGMDAGFCGEIPYFSPRHGGDEVLEPAVQRLPEKNAHQQDNGHCRGPHNEHGLTPLSTSEAIGLSKADLEANHSRQGVIKMHGHHSIPQAACSSLPLHRHWLILLGHQENLWSWVGLDLLIRSEERRVGKERNSRWV